MKDFIKEVFFVDVIHCIVLIKINLKDKRVQEFFWMSSTCFSVLVMLSMRLELCVYHKWTLDVCVIYIGQFFKGVFQNQSSPQVHYKIKIFMHWEIMVHNYVPVDAQRCGFKLEWNIRFICSFLISRSDSSTELQDAFSCDRPDHGLFVETVTFMCS